MLRPSRAHVTTALCAVSCIVASCASGDSLDGVGGPSDTTSSGPTTTSPSAGGSTSDGGSPADSVASSSSGEGGSGEVCPTPCTDGEVCQDQACVCNPKLPTGWPDWQLYGANPVMVASKQTTLQGQDNIYAPAILKQGDRYKMWYGAQGADGHDRIYFAWSEDAYTWQKWPNGGAPQPALDRGSSNHVNDPSVVFESGKYRVYYTDAAVDIDDRIWLAEGSQPQTLTKVKMVLDKGAAGQWDSEKVGRPSVVLDNGVYRMWYDGAFNGARHVGYAESSDGLNFKRYEGNPIFLNAGAIDVAKVGDVWVMLRESGSGTFWATSVDGLCWVDRGKLFGTSGAAYDAFGQVTPMLLVESGKPKAIYFGGAKVVSWDQNRIGLAQPVGTTPPPSGCTGCVAPGLTCDEACRDAGAGNEGSCGSPGSTTPGQCCACKTDGCEPCSQGTTCQSACANAGFAMGTCANPGNDPGNCCGCAN